MNTQNMTIEQADEILAQWGKNKSRTSKQDMARCPHCEGDDEEPGAPMDEDGVYLCSLCDGWRIVPVLVAQAWQVEQDETAQEIAQDMARRAKQRR